MVKASSRRARGKVPGLSVAVADTGSAEAADETAVTGYRGPVRQGGGPDSVRLSRTGDVTASGGSTAISGYVHTLTVQRTPREPASWPHQVGVVPSAARSFRHRAEADRLRAAVAGGGTAVLCQVLTGMGGVGKTQLAADHARSAWDEGALDVLVWVTASARSPVVSAYAQAGAELCRADPDDPERAAKEFLAWLAPKPGQRPCRWLIVLDDLADPNDLVIHPDDPARRYSLWPPASPYGRVLLTTRRRDAALFGQGRRRIEVGVFNPPESLAYLTASLDAQDRSEPAEQLTALACDLGHLPLALAQAAAYLVDSGQSAAAYRKLLADRATRLTDLAPDALPDDHAATLAAAWSLSIDRADTLRPAGLARPMLHLAAFLDANGIPHDVLTSPEARGYLAAHRTAAGPERTRRPRWWPRKRQRPAAPVTPEEAFGALRALDRLSLVDHTPGAPHQAVRAHQLIQRAARDTLTPGRHDRTARAAADALEAAWPDVERDADLAQSLRANTDALMRHAADALYQPDAHALLFRLGRSLGEAGQVAAAIDHFECLADITAHRLGPDHPGTLTTRNNLASWRGEAGDATGAAQAFAELLADRVRVLGPDHPDTLTTRNNLASWRGEAGDATGAAQAFSELFADQLRVLGSDHPRTLNTRNNLAYWRGEAGDATGAAQAFAELLADQVRVLGPDHPKTLTTRGNLASWRGEAGDAAGAAQAFAELLADRVRVLGPDHPDTLTTRNNLATRREKAGDAVGAARAFAELLADQVRVLGPDHPDTLTTRNNLASCKGEAGDAVGAARAFAELLADQVRVLGPDHPDTLTTRGNLASWRGEAGDATGAAQAFAELSADQVRVLGPDHPRTLTSRNNLAYWRGEAGDATGAAQAFTEVLADQVRVLGPDHPDTLATRNNLASWRAEAGDAVGAAQSFAELLADQARVLGFDHPRTFTTRNNLASWRGEAGDATGAAQAFAELLADQVRVLGPGHPDTLTTRNNLAYWRGEAGDATGAARAFAELLADQVRALGPDHPRTLTTRNNLAYWQERAGDVAGAADGRP
ncbi:FxSxx-COOH system tetratricopeptide repeat protein [Streptomyces toxytricini]|uniref:FxSxx-COOH system tetratricopeptide repeat protein n=3 Tax=Streptomyces TaxID=1883 RepID=UPI0019855907|nr:FxSxx-COOH system tetratricopeptide repeat protein [Streptomyces toxytricini]GGT21900.1 tetratricopeptide repeat protein [Streptomyces toxytricini]